MILEDANLQGLTEIVSFFLAVESLMNVVGSLLVLIGHPPFVLVHRMRFSLLKSFGLIQNQ